MNDTSRMTADVYDEINEKLEQLWADARRKIMAEGAAAERDRIVAWLREQDNFRWSTAGLFALRVAADELEREQKSNITVPLESKGETIQAEKSS